MLNLKQISNKIVIVSILIISCYSCNKYEKREILFAENLHRDFLGDSVSEKLYLFSDSIYIFTRTFKSTENNDIEQRKGKFIILNDTIHFSRNLFKDIKSKIAIIKDNYIEIIDEDRYKIKVVKTELPDIIHFDSKKFNNYALFSYCQSIDSSLFKNSKPYNLDNSELTQIDSLLVYCMSKDPQLKTKNNSNYYKQCIATINLNKEIVVWINCICNKSVFNIGEEFKLQIAGKVNDGGTCFFKLKMNLTKRIYFDLRINGDA